MGSVLMPSAGKPKWNPPHVVFWSVDKPDPPTIQFSNFTLNVTLPHDRYTVGRLHYMLQNHSAVSARSRRQCVQVLFGDDTNHAIGFTENITADVRSKVRWKNPDNEATYHFAASSGTGVVAQCRIINSGGTGTLRIRWVARLIGSPVAALIQLFKLELCAVLYESVEVS